MNYTKLDELAQECWIHTKEPLFGAKSPHWEFDRHKFAELIIGECAKIANEPTSRPFNSYGEKIKKHFGVN